MAQQYPGYPDDIYKYQNTFDYSVWTPNTEICCVTVPWDASYRDIVRFDSADARDTYFNEVRQYGYSFTLTGMVYLKYNEPIRVNVPFSQINQTNYLIVKNPVQPVPTDVSGYGAPSRVPDTFYYFVNDVQYVAPNTTQLNVQLDVWQTYYDRITFGLCYVNKGHIGIANENSTKYNIADYLTEQEGLNYGDEYCITCQYFINLLNTTPYIVITSTTDLEGSYGTLSDPELRTSKGDINDGMPNGSRSYAMNSSQFSDFMSNISDYPWVSQGISMITVVPSAFCQLGSQTSIAGVTCYRLQQNPEVDGNTFMLYNIYDNYNIPDRYKNLFKFFAFPYSFVEMTALNGGEIVLKNECMPIGTVTIDQETHEDGIYIQTRSVCAPPNIRGIAAPRNYNWDGTATDIDIDYYAPDGTLRHTNMWGGEYMDLCVQFSNFPQFSIVNDMYLYYMASNANTLAYQFASADWSQQKAQTAANLAYNQATNAMNTQQNNQAVANALAYRSTNLSNQQNATNAAIGAVGTLAGMGASAVTGNVGGVASGALNLATTAMSVSANNAYATQQTTMNVSANNATLRNNMENAAYNRDTNLDYANYAAQGDYEVAIQGIQAKVQDARITQPSTSGQNGGDPFNMSNGYYGILFKWKRIKTNFLVQIGEFWLRYGYYVNRWIKVPTDLKCMTKFTYWKMEECVVYATMPETFKEAVRGIFEKGVTVWVDPNYIGTTDFATNEPVGGISY